MAEADSLDSDGLGDWPSWDSLEGAVWDQSTWRRLAGALQALVSIAIILVLLGGTPVLLMLWGGWPLTDFPWLDEIESLPLTEETQQLILVLSGAAAWGSWAAFAAGVLGQVLSRLRRPGGAEVTQHRGAQEGGRPLAQRLVDSAAAGLSALRSPKKPDETPQTASVESEDPHPDSEIPTDHTPAMGGDDPPEVDEKSPDEEASDEDVKEDEQPSRTMTAVVSSAGHLTLSPWRIGVGTRWSGTRVTVIQTGLHVKIYDPEDRLIRELEVDPDRRYQPSGNSPGPQRQ